MGAVEFQQAFVISKVHDTSVILCYRPVLGAGLIVTSAVVGHSRCTSGLNLSFADWNDEKAEKEEG